MYLYKLGKFIIYKYYLIFKDFDYTLDMIYNLFHNIVVDFIHTIERKYLNFDTYFRGFLCNKFIDVERSLTSKKNKLIKNAISIDNYNQNGEINTNVLYLSSDEDVKELTTKELFYDQFLINDSSPLTHAEKLIIKDRFENKTFMIISKERKLTYRMVLLIYDNAIKKMKKVYNS